MILKLLAQILTYGLLGILAVYSFMAVYVLVRYGQSKILGLVMSGLYLLLMFSLYGLALWHFESLTFPDISL